MRTLSIVLAALALSSPAFAQSTPTGPLLHAGFSADRLLTVVGPKRTTAPRGPIDTWVWAFLKAPLVQGDQATDTIAFQYRVDCAASTTALLVGETYLGGAFQISQTVNAPPAYAEPDTLLANVVALVCDPARSGAPVFADIAAARAAATRQFGQ